MEKAVVFGPIILFFGFFALLVIAFLGFIVKLIFKSKNEEWTGEIVEKKHNIIEDSDDRPHDNYYLVVKMDNGGQRNVGMARDLWEKFNEGDKIKKPKGKLFPEKY